MTPRRIPAWIALGAAVLVGVLTAVQARMNGQLGVALDDGFVAALVSFGSGLGILIALTLLFRDGRRGWRALATGIREHSIPWWMLAGGAAGALTTASQGLAVGLIGVGLFTVGLVAGQTVCGLVLDRTGYGPAGVVAVTVPRLLGALLALCAVGVALLGDSVAGVPQWMLVLPFATGVGIAWQQATNGRLRQRVGTPLTATLVNFIGGTAVLAVAAIIHVGAVGVPQPFPPDVWMYFGGAAGVAYIFLGAAVVQHTGVLLLGLGSVTGQLVTSVTIDALWPAPSGPGLVQSLVMVVVALGSVVVATVPWRRLRR